MLTSLLLMCAKAPGSVEPELWLLSEVNLRQERDKTLLRVQTETVPL